MEEDRKQQVRIKVGLQLADLRNQAGLTTRDLAEKSGYSYSNINSIERGKYNVSIDILGAICEELNADILLVRRDSL